jgi:hypothetical protein
VASEDNTPRNVTRLIGQSTAAGVRIARRDEVVNPDAEVAEPVAMHGRGNSQASAAVPDFGEAQTLREPAEGPRTASPPSPNFVVTSHSRFVLGFLLAGLIEQRFPGCVCTIEGDDSTDINCAGARNPLNGNGLWLFATPPAPETLGALRATGNTRSSIWPLLAKRLTRHYRSS